jgi:RecA/RadA recombinase
MKDDNWFLINDFDQFVDHTRSLVFKFFGETNKSMDDAIAESLSRMSAEEISEMNETLTHSESVIIIKNHVRKQINKKTKTIRYSITDKILYAIIEELNSRMISNILGALVNKGVLDSAFDSEKNDFIFWVKDDNEKENKKPEAD